jgi:hypothetical protein
MAVVILKNVRLSYPDLHKPGKPLNDGDTPKYGAQFIMDPDSDAAKVAKDALTQAAQETFGANWQAIVGAMEKTKKCVRRGDDNLTKDGAIRDGYAGKLYLVARNKAKPLLIGPRKGADGQFPVLTEADGKPYGGCYVNVKVDIKAMKAKDRIPNQIYATLLTVQFVADGEAFGAAPGTSEGFDEVEGAEVIGASDASDLF